MTTSDLEAELQAASDEFVGSLVPEEAPSEVAVDRDRFRELLDGGGRVEATIRSKKSGEHVRVLLVAKKKGPDGRFVSRASRAGRVGMGDADVVFAEDPLAEWPENRVGTFWLDKGNWRPDGRADRARVWCAQMLLSWARGSVDLEKYGEIFVATRCSYCGKKLTDPVSVERGVGPECWGKATGSKSAKRNVLLPPEEES